MEKDDKCAFSLLFYHNLHLLISQDTFFSSFASPVFSGEQKLIYKRYNSDIILPGEFSSEHELQHLYVHKEGCMKLP